MEKKGGGGEGCAVVIGDREKGLRTRRGEGEYNYSSEIRKGIKSVQAVLPSILCLYHTGCPICLA